MSRSVAPARQAERRGRLGLPVRNRGDAGAHDLGDEAGGVGDEAEHQRDEFGIELQAAAQVEAVQFGEAEVDRPAEREIGERAAARGSPAPRRAPTGEIWPVRACRRRA